MPLVEVCMRAVVMLGVSRYTACTAHFRRVYDTFKKSSLYMMQSIAQADLLTLNNFLHCFRTNLPTKQKLELNIPSQYILLITLF